MLIYSILWIILLFAMEGLVYGGHIFLELSKIDFDLTDGHFGNVLIHIHLFLLEDGEGVLFPHLLYYVEPCIHLIVLRFYFLEPFQCIQFESPGPTFHSCSV